MGTVQWNGDALLDIIAQAAIEASDETNGLIDAQAKGDAPWITGTLRRGIKVIPAKRVSQFLVSISTVGVFDVVYALAVEIGFPHGATEDFNVKAHTRTRKGNTHSVRAHKRIIDPRKGSPFLRPAYDRYAPTLDQRMAKRLKGKIK